MKTKDVKKMKPIDRFFYWIKERHSIYLKKEAGDPKPWTDDEILQSYRFCNVRRMDDKVSQWLLRNWYEPNFNHENMVVACVMARHFNKPECLSAIGFPVVWRPMEFLSRIRGYVSRGMKAFNGAYIIHASSEYSDKSEMVINETCQQFVDNPMQITGHSLEETVSALMSYRNLGSFMAGQIAADLRWAISGEWSDVNKWAPIGPGSRRGMLRLLDRDIDITMTQQSFSVELRRLITLSRRRLPRELTSTLEAMDYQNCCCEFDKYERTLSGSGRPKMRYNGTRNNDGIGLPSPQVRILACLSKSSSMLTRKQIGKRARVDPTKVGDYAGPRPSNQTDKAKTRWGFPALDTLGYVHVELRDVGGRDVMYYSITDAGKEIIEGR